MLMRLFICAQIENDSLRLETCTMVSISLGFLS